MRGRHISIGIAALLGAASLGAQAAAQSGRAAAVATTSAEAPENRVSPVTVEGKRRTYYRFVPGRMVDVGQFVRCDCYGDGGMEDRSGMLANAYALYDKGDFKGALKEFNNVSWNWAEDPTGNREYDKTMRELTRESALMNAELYVNGPDELADAARGVMWLKRVAKSGKTVRKPVFDPARPYVYRSIPQIATVWLATLHLRGDKVAHDRDTARQWYEHAVKIGYVPALKKLGDMAAEDQDLAQAVRYYDRAAGYGLADAQVALADIYYTGAFGVAQDKAKATALYQRAALWQDPAALYALAISYEAGDGVAADPRRAVEYYEQAAKAGHPTAQGAYGMHLYEGSGVAKDHVEARRWLQIAAAAAEPEAIYNLAVMMMRGEGGEKDLAKAWVLLTAARQGGQPQADAALAVLERQMSPAERTAAAALLAPAASPRG